MGQIRKDLRSVEALVGLCYPDLYEIGMSHIGLKILYDIVNSRPEWAGERVYAVARDMEAKLRAAGRLLTTLENRIPLRDLDVLGFTLQYELSYTNLLQVLDLGGIPLRAADRDRDHPLVIAGGPCAFNPEPLAPFLDAVCLGDGEETLARVIETTRLGSAPAPLGRTCCGGSPRCLGCMCRLCTPLPTATMAEWRRSRRRRACPRECARPSSRT